MKTTVKLNPTRLIIPKYGNGLLLAMEYLSKIPSVLPSKITADDNNIELVLPYTKQSIRTILNYINNNI